MKNNIMTVERFKKEVGVHITTKMNGKMTGMQSLSTSSLNNKFCQARAKDPNSICSKCYAQRALKMFKSADTCFQRNADVLCNRILSKEELPVLNTQWFRFQSHGEILNETEVINYFNICKANKNTHFAIWVKNVKIIDNVIKAGYKKPRNLNIVVSSIYMNKVIDVKQYDWVDRVFTVYDKDYIKDHDVEINCGSEQCLSCLKCYRKSKKYFYIKEKLK